jgi:hypothetical protein
VLKNRNNRIGTCYLWISPWTLVIPFNNYIQGADVYLTAIIEITEHQDTRSLSMISNDFPATTFGNPDLQHQMFDAEYFARNKAASGLCEF